MKKFYLSLIFLLLGFGLMAQVPKTLSFQGVLTNNGTPVDNSNATIKFTIYDALTGGTEIWTETHTGINISEGVYNVILGSINPLNIGFDIPYYLDILYGAVQLSPRLELTAGSYALNSYLIDLSDGTLATLDVSGNANIGGDVTATSFSGTLSGDGSAVTGLNADNLASGTVPLTRLSGITTNELSATAGIVNGQIANLSASKLNAGTVPLGRLSGITSAQLDAAAGITSAQIASLDAAKLTGTAAAINGSAITDLNAGNLASGTVPVARLSGITTSQLSATAGIVNGQIASLDASKITSGTLNSSRLDPDIADLADGALDASKITSGTFSSARIPNLDASKITSGTINSSLLDSDIADLADGDFDNNVIARQKVGIGTASPSYGIHLYSSSYLITGIALHNTSSTTNWALTHSNNSIYLSPSLDDFASLENSTFQFTTSSFWTRTNANLGSTTFKWGTIYATNPTINTSDRRLKKDINKLKYGLSEILELSPVSYLWKDESIDERMHLGLIAQEVLEILPQTVIVGEDSEKTLSLSYIELIPVLIKAIQEQQEIIDSQGRNIDQLSAENESLKENFSQVDRRLKAIEEVLMLKAEQK